MLLINCCYQLFIRCQFLLGVPLQSIKIFSRKMYRLVCYPRQLNNTNPSLVFYSEEKAEWIEEAKLDGHSDWVRDVAWAPSIGLPRTVIASCSQDRRVILWTNDGISSSWTQRVLHTFDDVVWHVSWSVTGNILAVSGGDNKVLNY